MKKRFLDLEFQSLTDLAREYCISTEYLINVYDIADEELGRHLAAGLMQLVAKKIYLNNILSSFERLIIPQIQMIQERVEEDFIVECLQYIMSTGSLGGNRVTRDAFLQLLEKKLASESGTQA